MKRSDVRNAVHRVITDIQGASGRSASNLHGGTRPTKDLHDFDSFNCVEASCQLSISLGCEIKEDVALFKSNGQDRTIDEIVNDLCRMVSAEEG